MASFSEVVKKRIFHGQADLTVSKCENFDPFFHLKDWIAIAKLKPLSLFISLSLMLKKAFVNVKIEK